jgi:hypothetical protein
MENKQPLVLYFIERTRTNQKYISASLNQNVVTCSVARIILEVMPACKLWFWMAKNSKKTVSILI